MMQAGALDGMGRPDSALTCLFWAESHMKESCDSTLLMEIFSNYTAVYVGMWELERVDSISEIALDFFRPGNGSESAYLRVLNNYSMSKAFQQDIVTAERLFRRLYYEGMKYDFIEHQQRALINLGTVMGMKGHLDSAEYFLNQGSVLLQEEYNFDNHMTLLNNLSLLESLSGNYEGALAYLDSGIIAAEKKGSLEQLALLERGKAEVHANFGRLDSAYAHMLSFTNKNQEYLSEKRVTQVAEMTEKYESEKKTRHIKELEVDNLDKELQNERVTKSRNRFIFGGVGLFIIAIGLWSRLNYVRKSKAELQKEKDISEGLLLNILPEEVAKELKVKGYADAQEFEKATILFSDFKGFTSVSEKLTPNELVAEIDVCFKAFDEIMTKYKIEKIKTIGDAYMAAGGLPVIDSCSPEDVVIAAIEMQQFIAGRKASQDAAAKPAFEMRIGINSGVVVAGIVGVKKFQYDIWGDAVNTAARMESSGETGKVNISESTYNLVSASPKLSFSERGMIEAKGKGKLKMYFAELR